MAFHISLSFRSIKPNNPFSLPWFRKFRLDDDQSFNSIKDKQLSFSHLSSSSLLTVLNSELNSLLTNLFSIEYVPVSHSTRSIQLDDDYLSKNGLVLRCKLLEKTNPIIPILRIRVSTRYPDEQPEILSLTKTMPPKLEYTGLLFFLSLIERNHRSDHRRSQEHCFSLDGHPFFEQLSTIFVSQLFKLPSKHTITDILQIWVRENPQISRSHRHFLFLQTASVRPNGIVKCLFDKKNLLDLGPILSQWCFCFVLEIDP